LQRFPSKAYQNDRTHGPSKKVLVVKRNEQRLRDSDSNDMDFNRSRIRKHEG
jgi:hypothetical protein